MESLYHLYVTEKKPVITEEDIKNIYLYYCEGGFLPIFFRKLSGILIFIFISLVIFILIDGISYSKLYTINEMKIKVNNQNQTSIHYRDNLNQVIDLGLPEWYSIIYLIIVTGLIGIRILLLFRLIPLLLRMKYFYQHHFEISDSSLHAISWDIIVSKISNSFEVERLDDEKIRCRQQYNEVQITNVIMKHDNYMIGLIQYLRLKPFKSMTSHLEETFIQCVFETVFNTEDGKKLLTSVKLDHTDPLELGYNNILLKQTLSRMIATKMRTLGTFRLLISPFIFLYMLVKFLLEYGEKIYSDPKSISSKIWTPYSKYQFRNYNELPHVFNHRLHKGEKRLIKYLNHLSFSRFSPLYKLGIFISGSIIILILFFNMITNNQILSSKFCGINLVTWIAVLGLIIALFRSLLKKSSTNSPDKIVKSLHQLSEDLLYLPSSWIQTPFSPKRESEISVYYNYQLSLSFFELLSPFTTPYKIISLSTRSQEIIDFMIQYTIYNPKVGYICKFSDFDHRNCLIPSDIVSHSSNRLEKSIFDFKEKHPSWKP